MQYESQGRHCSVFESKDFDTKHHQAALANSTYYILDYLLKCLKGTSESKPERFKCCISCSLVLKKMHTFKKLSDCIFVLILVPSVFVVFS